MGNFNRNFGRQRDFKRKDRDFRRDSRQDREMHEITCDKCGNKAEVPFKPSTDKPVYCSECFKAQQPERREGRSERRDFQPRRSERRDFQPRPNQDLQQLNEKLDKIIRILESAQKKNPNESENLPKEVSEKPNKKESNKKEKVKKKTVKKKK